MMSREPYARGRTRKRIGSVEQVVARASFLHEVEQEAARNSAPKSTRRLKRMISKTPETIIYLQPTLNTKLTGNRKLDLRVMRNYKSTGRNIQIVRNSLVNYLRLVSLYSCYDMLTPYTLLAFLLFLNCFITAQHSQQNSRAVLTSVNYWNWSAQNRPQQSALTMTAVSRNVEVKPSGRSSSFDGGQFAQDDAQQQQRLVMVPDEFDDQPASSEPVPSSVVVSLDSIGDHYDIQRTEASRNALSSNLAGALARNSTQTKLDKVSTRENLAPAGQRRQSQQWRGGSENWPIGGSDRPQKETSGYRTGSQHTHAAELSFRHAQADELDRSTSRPSDSSNPVKTTLGPESRPNGARELQQGILMRDSTDRSRLAIDESHWIPITRTAPATLHHGDLLRTPLRMMPQPSTQAASALLDYPPAQRPPPSPPLQQLDSFAYGQRNPPLIDFHRPHSPGHSHYEPFNGNHFHHEGRHYNHYHNDHQYTRHNHHWPRRRPRFQNEIADNELGPPPPMRPRGKMYKRVLLCDKTLVSLDYIRNVNFDPMPDRNGGAGGHLLDEHEINEISDSFLDLENHLEVQMSRPSPTYASGNDIDDRPRNNTSSPATRIDIAANNGTNTNSTANQLAAEASGSSSSNRLERRSAAWQLLSDEDPLVRCDMWDLEKGLKSRKPPREILRMAIKTDFDTVRDAINRCRQLSERTLPPDDELRGDGYEMIMSTEDLISFFSVKRGLMPGTKWCGLGDQADSYNDLGPKHRIDICCRAHDHCPIRSKPFRNDYGILNIGLYTKSHCDCDADFYRCLREVRSRTADMLGNLYFNVMKLQCMREERLKVCREAKPIALGFERCVRYEDSPVKTVFKFTTPPVAY